ncbi:DNA polymerase III subunit gamma/tau [Aliikangiella sp. G2MR2-5]|uniref:DNA polymerase III subunit gamma/tau n=1 Tax=Aliikangiella sp. G2MR2-5 TaxID=2788943 RepID=UPI0018AA7EEB|nr:DNA polymerase III subunit gamma/tau [Aliikangiella sp. G2MR2-5]
MSYQVLARKWRPGNFNELVGQKQTAQALSNALQSQRLHHAYLFTGTRGVGKTTIARILAKSLNCEKGITAEPCGQCGSCIEIAQGNFVDLMEIDAASKTKVEDTRELLDNVQYRPTRGRYKVYLIDEVHMLSGHSFNALLKTLEEPPPHVIFLLATTDPQKLPVTVLSRCLQFHLRRMDAVEIINHLSNILRAENIEFEEGALVTIAKGADGSMRDALSLMDQAIAFCGGNISHAQVLDMLGTIDRSYAVKLLKAVISEEPINLIHSINEIAEFSPDFDELMSDWLTLLHQIAVCQAVGSSNDSQVEEMAELVSPADLQLFYQLSLHARKDMPFAPTQRQGFEMAMLRIMAFKPDGQSPKRQLPSKKKTNREPIESLNAGTSTTSDVTSNAKATKVDKNTEKDNTDTSLYLEPGSYSNQQFALKQQAEAEEFVQLDVSQENIEEKKASLRVVVDNKVTESGVLSDEVGNENADDASVLEEYDAELSDKLGEQKVKAIMQSIQEPIVNPVSTASHENKSQKRQENISPIREEYDPIELQDVNRESWYQVVNALAIEGNGKQILLNSVAETENNKITIKILEKVEPLLTSSAKEMILEQIKSYFSATGLSIEFVAIKDDDEILNGIETPKERQVRLLEEAIDKAEEKLALHPQVSLLLEQLGAKIIRESIEFKAPF